MIRQSVLLAVLVMFLQPVLAQHSSDKLWSVISETAIRKSGKRQIIPSKYFAARLDDKKLKEILFSAPHERRVNINQSSCVIFLVDPHGSLIRVSVVESPVMDETLSESFPDIKTFSFRGLDDPRISGKLDWNEFGFHGMVFSPRGDFYIDPYCLGNTTDYISYFTADFHKRPEDRQAEAGLIRNDSEAAEKKNEDPAASQKPQTGVCVGSNLKTYRLAVACTGEYAIAATGLPAPNVSQTLAKVVTSVNRVSGVYEHEVSMRLILVSTTTLVLYTDPATDSFTGTANTNPAQLIDLSQTIITASIGSTNFDVGHTFSTGAGGMAFFASVCKNNEKAKGVTGSNNPVGDPYDIDFVAHEIGHQFGANHTFNAMTSGCFGNRNGATAVEPGSGVTVMAYAGLCASQDISNHSIPYLHTISFDEIVDFLNSLGGCAVDLPTGNLPPVMIGAGTVHVPKGTPFFLTGGGSDPDGDLLTFSWEEIDRGASGSNWDAGKKPYFRSYAPDTVPTRYFPITSVVLSGNHQGTKGEYLPTKPDTLRFRLTGRDGKMGGGGLCYDSAMVIIDTTGPFVVTYPSATDISWRSNTDHIITWDRNHTDLAPISCSLVSILLSFDGGNTYQALANAVPNSGSYQITAPDVSVTISTCRIKVEGYHSNFYDVSNNNFTIFPRDTYLAEVFSQNNPFELTAWPNPVNEDLKISATGLNSRFSTSLAINDVVGKEIFRKDFDGLEILKESIDLSALESGLYFVSVRNNGRQSVYRIIRQ